MSHQLVEYVERGEDVAAQVVERIGTKSAAYAQVAVIMASSAGRRRLARRSQNCLRSVVTDPRRSSSSSDVMR